MKKTRYHVASTGKNLCLCMIKRRGKYGETYQFHVNVDTAAPRPEIAASLLELRRAAKGKTPIRYK